MQAKPVDNYTMSRMAALANACRLDPLKWAEVAWRWGEGDLRGKTLRTWQREVLADLRDHLQNPATRHKPFRAAVASGHGIGKSALMAMIGDWAMSCHKKAKVKVTANTEGQLRTTTAPEFSKWFNSSMTRDLFTVEATKIAAKADATWRLDFASWSENNTEAFQGMHNSGRLVAVLMDEGSAVADTVWDVIEGAMTDADTILIFIVFGNPTRNTGRFRECWRRYRSQWKTYQIDSRTVEGVNTEVMGEWSRLYGEDSDFMKVRVRGVFPSSSDRQFIGTKLVDDAFGTSPRPDQFNFAPIILTCDPAWTGADELVIGMRQGLFFDVLEVIRSNDNDVLIAQKLAHYETTLGADALFIDAGYGTGIKSAGDVMGRAWQLVWFAGAPANKGYLNKRAEMWGLMKEWLRQGGSLPDDQVLYEDLIGPETLPRLDGKIALESKEDMRRRKLPSPNRADALALSFAAPVAKRVGGGYSVAKPGVGAVVASYDHQLY